MGRDSRARKRHHQRACVGYVYTGPRRSDRAMDALIHGLVQNSGPIGSAMMRRLERATGTTRKS